MTISNRALVKRFAEVTIAAGLLTSLAMSVGSAAMITTVEVESVTVRPFQFKLLSDVDSMEGRELRDVLTVQFGCIAPGRHRPACSMPPMELRGEEGHGMIDQQVIEFGTRDLSGQPDVLTIDPIFFSFASDPAGGLAPPDVPADTIHIRVPHDARNGVKQPFTVIACSDNILEQPVGCLKGRDHSDRLTVRFPKGRPKTISFTESGMEKAFIPVQTIEYDFFNADQTLSDYVVFSSFHVTLESDNVPEPTSVVPVLLGLGIGLAARRRSEFGRQNHCSGA